MIASKFFVVLLATLISGVTAQLEEFPDCAIICGNEVSGECGTVEATFCVCALPTFSQDIMACVEKRCSETETQLTRELLPLFCAGEDDDTSSTTSSSTSATSAPSTSADATTTVPPPVTESSFTSVEPESSSAPESSSPSASSSESKSSSESTSSTESSSSTSETSTSASSQNLVPSPSSSEEPPAFTEIKTSFTVLPPVPTSDESEDSEEGGAAGLRGSVVTLGAMVLLGVFLV